MILEFNIYHVLLVLCVWSSICALLTIACYPYGSMIKKIAFIVATIVIGPLIPFIAIMALPKVFSDYWINYSKDTKNSISRS